MRNTNLQKSNCTHVNLLLHLLWVSGNMEPVSAFSVYTAKRKNTEELLSKKGKKRSLQKVSNRKSKKQRKNKQIKASANQQTHEGE